MATVTNQDPKTISDWMVTITVAGEEVDISNMITQISIYESIYNNCMFGNVQITDNMGILETFALVGSGEEEITIDIKTPNAREKMITNDLNKVFTLDSLQDVKRSGDGTGTNSFVLGFVSPFLVKNNITRISRSFDAMTSSEIVEYVAYDILELGMDGALPWTDLMTNEKSKHTKNIVVPNWKPFELVNFLSKNSVSEEGDSNYIFFENNEGFHFTTLEKLKTKDVTRMVSMSEIPTEMNAAGVMIGNKGEKYSEQERFNNSKNISRGMFGGRVVAHDIITKSIETFDIENKPGNSKLGDIGFADAFKGEQVAQSHLGYMSSNYMYNIHHKSELSHYPLYDQKMLELRSNTIKFDIPGDTNIYAGDVIEVLIPSMTPQSYEMDRYMSGNFLVTAIHHKLSNNEYVSTLECSKDGFDQSVIEFEIK